MEGQEEKTEELIPKLKDKVLLIKDATTMLHDPSFMVELRELYDGKRVLKGYDYSNRVYSIPRPVRIVLNATKDEDDERNSEET